MAISKTATVKPLAGQIGLAFGISASVAAVFALASPHCRHWFVLPAVVCGGLLLLDIIPWVKGEQDVLDPSGLVGLLCLHFFYISPLLQAANDYWMEDWTSLPSAPSDWRPWFGWLLLLTAVGLCLYRQVSTWISDRPRPNPPRERTLDSSKLLLVLSVLMIPSLAVQIGVYIQSGGLQGYFDQYGSGGLPGAGRLLLIAESFPLLVATASAIWLSRRKNAPSYPQLFFYMLTMLGLVLLFGGLRGSRSTIIWLLFLTCGLIHFYVRAVPRLTVAIGLVVLVVFVYGYGFFKWAGTDALVLAADSKARSEWIDRTNRTFLRALSWDLSRANLQSAILYRLETNEDYRYAFGRTYIGTAALIIPKSIWKNRPPNKSFEGTELMVRKHAFRNPKQRRNWVYGIPGEAALNFGPIAIPLSYVLLGLLVGHTRRWIYQLAKHDARRLSLPLLVLLCLLVPAMDSSVLLVLIAKNATLPLAALWLASRFKVQRRLQAHPAASPGTSGAMPPQ